MLKAKPRNFGPTAPLEPEFSKFGKASVTEGAALPKAPTKTALGSAASKGADVPQERL